MSKKRGRGSTVLFAILVALTMLMFFGVISFRTDDLNDFFNLLRDIWRGSGR